MIDGPKLASIAAPAPAADAESMSASNRGGCDVVYGWPSHP
jgi:hypothetical protein